MSDKTFSIINGKLRITYPGWTGPDQYDRPCDNTLEFTEAEMVELLVLLHRWSLDSRISPTICQEQP